MFSRSESSDRLSIPRYSLIHTSCIISVAPDHLNAILILNYFGGDIGDERYSFHDWTRFFV